MPDHKSQKMYVGRAPEQASQMNWKLLDSGPADIFDSEKMAEFQQKCAEMNIRKNVHENNLNLYPSVVVLYTMP